MKTIKTTATALVLIASLSGAAFAAGSGAAAGNGTGTNSGNSSATDSTNSNSNGSAGTPGSGSVNDHSNIGQGASPGATTNDPTNPYYQNQKQPNGSTVPNQR